MVRRADPCDGGGYVLTVDGLFKLVNGRSAQFLTRLEQQTDPTAISDPDDYAKEDFRDTRWSTSSGSEGSADAELKPSRLGFEDATIWFWTWHVFQLRLNDSR